MAMNFRGCRAWGAAGLLLVPWGCAGPGPVAPPPVAVAAVEVVTNPVVNPDPNYTATCQTGAIVRLVATGSHDPRGLPLTYVWHDRIDGTLAPDFGPGLNPLTTRDAETGVLLSSIAVHDIELTVTAPDGRKARASVSVLVTSCVVCGNP